MAKRNSAVPNAKDDLSPHFLCEVDKIAAGIGLAHEALQDIANGGHELKLPKPHDVAFTRAWLQLEVALDLLDGFREDLEWTKVFSTRPVPADTAT